MMIRSRAASCDSIRRLIAAAEAMAVVLLFTLGAAGQVPGGTGFNLPGAGDASTAGATATNTVGFGGPSVVTITLNPQADAAAAGSKLQVAVELDIAEHYHVQIHKPQLDYLVPTDIALDGAPKGITLAGVHYPEPTPIKINFGDGPQTLNFYKGHTAIIALLAIDPSVPPGDYDLKFKTTAQACNETACLPPQTTTSSLKLKITTAANAPPLKVAAPFLPLSDFGKAGASPTAGSPSGNTLNVPLFGYDFNISTSTLLPVILIALIGGFLLNLTPCVLPLIPIKIMSLAHAAGNRRRCLMFGLIMCSGIVVFWLALGVIISTISWFTAANQLFQYPAFTIGVGIVIAVMGAGMMGLFATRLPQWVYKINPSQDTVHGSFGFGVMAAILSTPCTAPFMGAAAGWSVTQGPVITMSIFAVIGIGMALPYGLLAAWPKLVEKMPRTGPASELIKQVMGLLTLAAAAYFIGTGIAGVLVDPPTPPALSYWYFVAFFIAAAGAWLAWRTWQMHPMIGKRITFVVLGLLFVAAAGHIAYHFTSHGPIRWIYYTPDRLAEARQSKKVVVLEFTAEWCLNCHALEQTVLYRKDVSAALNGNNVAAIKVDLTGKNKAGNEELTKAGRTTIPLLVVYAPDGSKVFESDAYSPEQVIGAIEKAKGST